MAYARAQTFGSTPLQTSPYSVTGFPSYLLLYAILNFFGLAEEQLRVRTAHDVFRHARFEHACYIEVTYQREAFFMSLATLWSG